MEEQKVGALNMIKVLKAGLEIDKKPIPVGTILSTLEIYDQETEVPFYFLMSKSCGRGVIRKIILYALVELDVVKFISEEELEMGVGVASNENPEYPDVVNLSPPPGSRAFF